MSPQYGKNRFKLLKIYYIGFMIKFYCYLRGLNCLRNKKLEELVNVGKKPKVSEFNDNQNDQSSRFYEV